MGAIVIPLNGVGEPFGPPAFIQPRMVPPVAYRAMAILHIATFDALNSIEPRYQPYYAQFPATQDTSKDAVAAAGAVLVNLLPEIASDIQASLQSYLPRRICA